MNAFRTVFFRPRLALDWKIPVMALVETSQGTRPVMAELVPGANCLGSAASHSLLKNALARIERDACWSGLPLSVGPHFELGEPRLMPSVPDPIRWVVESVLPNRQKTEGEEATKPVMKTVAWNHLVAWSAAQYVRKRLTSDNIGEVRAVPEGIAITHYVPGKNVVLLMEPLSFSGSSWHSQVTSIFMRFSTYQRHWDHRSGRKAESIAYVLPGASPKDFADQAKRELAPVCNLVFTGVTEQRVAFVEKIAEVGKTAELIST